MILIGSAEAFKSFGIMPDKNCTSVTQRELTATAEALITVTDSLESAISCSSE